MRYTIPVPHYEMMTTHGGNILEDVYPLTYDITYHAVYTESVSKLEKQCIVIQ